MPALHCSKRIGSDWQYPRVSLVVPAGNQHLSACSHLVIGGRRQDAPIHASNFGPMAAFPCTVELVAITPADQNQGCPLLSVSSACHPQRTLFHAAQENERPSAGSRVWFGSSVTIAQRAIELQIAGLFCGSGPQISVIMLSRPNTSQGGEPVRAILVCMECCWVQLGRGYGQANTVSTAAWHMKLARVTIDISFVPGFGLKNNWNPG